MLELIQENNVIIGIIIGIITLFITMRQIIISNQKHRMDKEDFISKNTAVQRKYLRHDLN